MSDVHEGPAGRLVAAVPLRMLATAFVAILALVDIFAIALLLSGARTVVRLGFRRLRVHDIFGAAEVGAGLCALLLVLGWRWRAVRYGASGGLIAMAILAVALHAAGTSPRFPIGDGALLELYTLLAAQGKLVVGPYSRFIWHHPGPLYFWLTAPLYSLAEYRGVALQLAVLIINMSSIVTVAWFTARFASNQLAIVLLSMTAAYVWRIDEIVMSAWNPHVPILPAAALAAVSSAIAAGTLGLLPLAAVIASFIAQTHIGLLGYAVGLPAAAIVAVFAGVFTGARRLDLPTRRVFNLTMWLLVALWSGPIAEQLTHTPGNMTRLWRFFFVEEHSGPPFREALVAWADNVAGMFWPGFRISGGGVFVPSRAVWPLVWAALQVLLAGAAMLWFRAKRYHFDAAFSLITLVSLILSLWSVIQIVGNIPEYSIVWISVVGMLGATVVGTTIMQLIVDKAVPGWQCPRWIVRVAAIGLVIVCAVTLWDKYYTFRNQGVLSAEEKQVQALYDGIRAHLRESKAQRPLLRMQGDVSWAFAAGVGLQLQHAGQAFAVEGAAIPLFTEAFVANGSEDAEITIATLPHHKELVARRGNVVVARVNDLYADAIAISYTNDP